MKEKSERIKSEVARDQIPDSMRISIWHAAVLHVLGIIASLYKFLVGLNAHKLLFLSTQYTYFTSSTNI